MLSDIKLSSAITEFKNYTFYQCNNLTSVSLGSEVNKIGHYAFVGSSLEDVTILSDDVAINNYAFGYDSDITIYCKKDSNVNEFAESRGFKTIWID